MNILGQPLDAIKESYRVVKKDGHCIYDIPCIDDRNSKSTQKWLSLMENDDDPDFEMILDMMYDIKKWETIQEDIGFSCYNITPLVNQDVAPDTDKFPYNFNILRWTGAALFVAQK